MVHSRARIIIDYTSPLLPTKIV